jgi:hypothetical protein
MSPSGLLKISACFSSNSRETTAQGNTWKLLEFNEQATFLTDVVNSRYCNEAASLCNGKLVFKDCVLNAAATNM